jgi:MFS family permease
MLKLTPLIVRSEFKDLSEDMRHISTRLGMTSYFLWATSLYGTLLWLVDHKTHSFTIIIMMFGYLTGVGILGFCRKIKDEKIIRTAFVITVSFMSIFFILNPFIAVNNSLLSMCLFFCALANAFLSPTILTLFSKERGIHQQGKGFGLIVSADSAGFLIACIAIKIFGFLRFDLKYMIVFSFIVFLISWIPYSKYEKVRIRVPRIKKI